MFYLMQEEERDMNEQIEEALVAAGVELVEVPAGEYRLGSQMEDPAALLALPARWGPLPGVNPRQRWTCPGGWISRSPLTVGQWRALTDDRAPGGQLAGLAGAEDLARSEGRRVVEPEVTVPPRHGEVQACGVERPPDRTLAQQMEPDPPLELPFEAAAAVAAALGLELPDWRLWEAAARGPGGLRYPWGDALDTELLSLEHQDYSVDTESTMGYYSYDQDVYFLRSFGDRAAAPSPCGLVGLARPGREWNRAAPGDPAGAQDRVLRSVCDLGNMAYMVPRLRPNTWGSSGWHAYAHLPVPARP